MNKKFYTSNDKAKMQQDQKTVFPFYPHKQSLRKQKSHLKANTGTICTISGLLKKDNFIFRLILHWIQVFTPGIKNNERGFTFLELMTAVSITAIIGVSLFSSYVPTKRYVYRHVKRAAVVEESVLLRKNIDSYLSGNQIKLVSSHSVTFSFNGSDSLQTLSVKGGALYAGSKLIRDDIERASFRLDPGEKGRGYLLWEISFGKSGWSGGAVEVTAGTP